MKRLTILRPFLVAAIAVAGVYPSSASAAALRAPGGLTPAHRAVVPAMPVFKWNAVRNAARYDFQVSASRNFSSLISGRGGSVGTVKTKNTAGTIDRAHPDGSYFWRVRAVSRAGRAGRWTSPRELIKRWDLTPQLISPIGGATVTYPDEPLLFRWAPVTGALKYEVDIALDPTLSTPAFKTTKRVIETAGTVLTMQSTLSSGTYYWAVTPLDSRGNRGVRSDVQSFTWTWPSTTRTNPVTDLDDRPGIFDPLLSWSPVGGAARYEVEVSTSDSFAPGSIVCCDEDPLSTSLSPKKILPNNQNLFWRVRAIDAGGNVGVWSNGSMFRQSYDPNTPGTTVRGLTLRDEDGVKDLSGGPPPVSNPLITWEPVPGASSYEVRVVPFRADIDGCDWNYILSGDYEVRTATPAWSPMASTWNGNLPEGLNYNRSASYDAGESLADGTAYCMRVRARRDRDAKNEEVVSQWTQLKAAGGDKLFVYDAPLIDDVPPPKPVASTYVSPVSPNPATPGMPWFAWQAVDGAKAYFVVVASDPEFKDIIDVALTRSTTYAPRANTNPRTYADAAGYYWAIIPAKDANGGGTKWFAQESSPRNFAKIMAPPTPLAPADGASVMDLPMFRWTSAFGARTYRLQVSTDPGFANLVDDVTTSSTAYVALSTYPVDAALYWRVRATDETGIGLGWSPTRTLSRVLPVPALDPANPTGGTVIPALLWTRIPGAIAYDLAVDQSDGTRRDFRIPTAAFTPATFYGTGVWSFRVRGVFPGKGTATVTGPYTGRVPFARSIGVPSSAKTEARRGRMVLQWEHAPGVKEYRVELSKTTSFETLLDARELDGTAYAPTLDRDDLRFGKIYWRVAAKDEGGNRGAFKVGSFSAGASLKVALKGRLRNGRSSRITITVKDGKKIVRGAVVEVTGAGIRARRGTTNRRGRVTLRVAPRRGTVEIKVSTTDGRFGRITRRVR